jgi:hypothetical protein
VNGEGESNMDINKYFDNYLDITTKDGKTIHIEKKNVYINDSSQISGNINIIRRKNNNNIIVLKEVYSYEDKRLRYSYNEYTNPKVFDTYEINESGEEVPITVIETYSEKQTKIGSIGNIRKVNSDKEFVTNKKTKILKLLKPKTDKKIKANVA